MPALAERLANLCATGARLTCASRVDFHKHAPSTFSLVREHEKEGRPPSIMYRLARTATRKCLDVQIFDGDKAVSVYDLSRFLVVEVPSLIANVVIPALQQQKGLTLSVRVFRAAANTPLESFQFGLSVPEPSRVLYGAAVACGSKGSNPNVNADRVWIKGQRLGITLHAKQRIPASRFPLNREGLDCAFKRTVQLDPDVADFREPDFVSLQRVPNLPKCNAVIACLRSESWVAWLLSILRSSKECTKGEVDALQYILKHVSVYVRNIFSRTFNLRQLKGLIEVRDRRAYHLPRISSFLKSSIIKLGAYCECAFQPFGLFWSGEDSVSKGLIHGTYFNTADHKGGLF